MDYFWNERYRSTFLSGIVKKISMNASVLSFFLRFLFDLLRAAFNNFTFTMAFSFINDARLCVNLSKYTLVQGARVNCKKGSHEPATTSLWSNGYNVSFPVTLIKPVHVTFTSSRIRRYRTCMLKMLRKASRKHFNNDRSTVSPTNPPPTRPPAVFLIPLYRGLLYPRMNYAESSGN